MLLRSRLFRRLFLPYLALIVSMAGVLGVLAATRLRHSHVEDRRRAFAQEARLVARMVRADLQDRRFEELQRTLPDIAALLRARITIIAEDGSVLADTMAHPRDMDNHRLRPEIVEAAATGEGAGIRWSDTVRADLLYVAVRTDSGCYVRLAEPLSRLAEHLAALYWGLAIALLAAVGAAGVLCYVFALRHTRPLFDLANLAEAFARGELERRSTFDKGDEVGALARALNDMGASLAGLVSQVARDKQRLLTIVSAMGDGLIATVRHQHVVLANPAAASQFALDADKVVGKPLWESVRYETLLKAAATVVQSGRPDALDLTTTSGRVLRIDLRPLPESGLVLVSHDKTESARYDELRREFVANVSHELRTPLTLIKGFVETLRDDADLEPRKTLEFLGIIEKHVAQLTNLVDDLLDLAELESRPGLPRAAKVDLSQTVQRVVDLVRPAAQKKEQSLEVAPSTETLVVAGDPDYLERAVMNLVDNAIKYTPARGGIRVALRSRDGKAVVEVIDNGIGIPPDALPRIWERFYRVDKSRSREMGGTGLGLSIVKHVAQVHGGSVEVESKVGEGSVFRIVLPLMHANGVA
ncbi:MAG: HAMP domain-containing protein [Planctomycetes bacterium]|nr:HAMP domain-containing protein [Planctomycetota bacterium]